MLKFPCGTCSKVAKEFTDCICCDNCNIWFHKSCLDMSLATFDYHCLSKSLTWICPSRHFPSFLNNCFTSCRLTDKKIYNSLAHDYNRDDSDTRMVREVREVLSNQLQMPPQLQYVTLKISNLFKKTSK